MLGLMDAALGNDHGATSKLPNYAEAHESLVVEHNYLVGICTRGPFHIESAVNLQKCIDEVDSIWAGLDHPSLHENSSELKEFVKMTSPTATQHPEVVQILLSRIDVQLKVVSILISFQTMG